MMKRVVSVKVAEEKTFRKLRDDIDVLPSGHRDKLLKQQEKNNIQAKIAARRN